MQRQVPPPEANVIIAHFAQKQGREHEQDRDDLHFGRNLDRQLLLQQFRSERSDHHCEDEKHVHPALFGNQEHELDGHCRLKHEQDAKVRRSCEPVSAPLRGSIHVNTAQVDPYTRAIKRSDELGLLGFDSAAALLFGRFGSRTR